MSKAVFERLKSSYRAVSSIPTVALGRIEPRGGSYVQLSQLDAVTARKVSSGVVFDAAHELAASALPVDAGIKLQRRSRFDRTLWTRVRAGEKDKEKSIIELWGSDGLRDAIEIGTAPADAYEFDTLDLSPSGRKLLFAAEVVKTKPGPIFKDDPDPKPPTASAAPAAAATPAPAADDSAPLGATSAFEFKESWGEQITTAFEVRLFVLDWDARKVEMLSTDQPERDSNGYSVGQGLWLNTGDDILFTRYSLVGGYRRNGLRFCINRPSSLQLLRSSASVPSGSSRILNLTTVESGWNARSPCLSADGSIVIYLDCSNAPGIGDTHFTASRLCAIDLPGVLSGAAAADKPRVLIDLVHEPDRKDPDNAFPGLYITNLAPRLVLGSSIFVDTIWRTGARTLLVNAQSGATVTLDQKKFGRGVRTLDVAHIGGESHILFAGSCSTAPDAVYRAIVDHSSGNLHSVTLLHSCGPELAEVSSELLRGEFGEALMLHAKGAKKLIAFPHGGPHSAFTGEWGPATAFFLRNGYSVLQINYRGSIGFGINDLLSLRGKYGTQDVDDCVQSIDLVMQNPKYGLETLYLYGGSHGGFLSSHLVGDERTRLRIKATALRNPVINMASMANVTDIPDWTYCAIGENYHSPSASPEEIMVQMYKASPIANIDKVQAAVLLLVGAKDLRVPPSQGIDYYYQLKKRGVDTKMLVFPEENHPIAGSNAEPDATINSLFWFETHP